LILLQALSSRPPLDGVRSFEQQSQHGSVARIVISGIGLTLLVPALIFGSLMAGQY